MDWPVTLLARCTNDKPVSKVSSCCSDWNRACSVAELSKPCTPGVLPGLIENGRVTSPVQKIGLPATDRIGGNDAPLLNVGPNLSATLPAHPAFGGPESWGVCHWSCWAEGEKRLY